jgi:Leucine-rich repeat (LRR) protein
MHSLLSCISSSLNVFQKLCLRQNVISKVEFPDCIGATVKDIDVYDNLIGHLKGFENTPHLTSLDLSFNKLKHIKNIAHLTELRDLYFVQNRISTIEGLETLTKLRNLELAANRIRVRG